MSGKVPLYIHPHLSHSKRYGDYIMQYVNGAMVLRFHVLRDLYPLLRPIIYVNESFIAPVYVITTSEQSLHNSCDPYLCSVYCRFYAYL